MTQSLRAIAVFLAACASASLAHPSTSGIAREVQGTAQTSAEVARVAAGDEQQILWQRNLDDALALARAQSRPLFLVVNMDGESASERIVRERYRDPKWVALTRPFVCVVSSVFRHAPRDHDESGRRIPCPRLGEVTCGEHIALEPVLYNAFLQGERISPRHAVATADGEKSFDLFLLFDLVDLDRALAEASAVAPAADTRDPAAVLASSPTPLWERPADFALLRDHESRLAVESVLASGATEAQWAGFLDALAAAGVSPDPEVLRILIARSSELSDDLLASLPALTRGSNAITVVADLVRERFASHGPAPGAPGLGADARLLPLLAEADPTSPAVRTLLTSYVAVGDDAERLHASRGLKTVADPSDHGRVETAIRDEGGGESLTRMLELARAVTRAFAAEPEPPEELPQEAALEAELATLEAALVARPDDGTIAARYGRASLLLARKRIETGGSGINFLLEDAAQWLERASSTAPKDLAILVDRMRTSYQLSVPREQERLARTALGAIAPLPRAPEFEAGFPRAAEIERTLAPFVAALESPPERPEILRWLGDASARLLNERSEGDPVEEALAFQRGARAFGWVAIGPRSNESDWLGLASFFGAVGRTRDELACLQEGALRLPDSTPLRTALNAALWRAGRVDLAPIKAEWIQAAHPQSGAAAWFTGYAHVLAAENARRDEDPARAILEYDSAEARFEQSIALAPEYEPTARYYVALAWLGRGFAHLLAEQRADAADCLPRAIAIHPAIGEVRDGLDREAVDLLDGALEWRESGASPVDVEELCRRMVQADPTNAAWARAIADSELREGLRADGRDDFAAGDRYLERSIRTARMAHAIGDDLENRRALAQSCSVHAERLLARDALEAARPWAIEACAALQRPELAPDAPREAVEAALADLRKELGEARPRFRPGR